MGAHSNGPSILPITYVSRGTVRAAIRFDKGVSKNKIYFIPSPEYSIKHEHSQFAAFVSECGKMHHVRLEDDEGGNNSAALECPEWLSSAAAIAAAARVQVEVEVEKSTTSVNDCKVIAVTVPVK